MKAKRTEPAYDQPAKKLRSSSLCGGLGESFWKFVKNIFSENAYDPNRSQNSSRNKILGH